MVLQCRLCLRDEEAQFTSIFDSSISLVMIIWNCCQLIVKENDGLPDTICSFCKQKLESFSVFKLTCRKSNEILRNKLPDLNKVQENLHKEKSIVVYKPINKRRRKTYKLNKLKKKLLEKFAEMKKLQQSRLLYSLLNPPNVDSEEEQEHNQWQDCTVTENITSEENTVKTFICRICSQEFSDELSLKDHQEVHEENTRDTSPEGSKLKDEVICDMCNETFDNKTCLIEHINFQHMRIYTGPLKCETCSKLFKNERALERHNVKNHINEEEEEEPKHKCVVCSKEFINNDILEFHKLTHKEDTRDKSPEGSKLKDEVICDVCNEKFENKTCLIEHINFQHMRIYTGPLKCETCSKLFKNERALERHNVENHNEEGEEEEKEKEEEEEEEVYKIHMKSHPGAKTTFKCRICPKTFLYKSVYKSHMLLSFVKVLLLCTNMITPKKCDSRVISA
ncbi:uncharacterized protein LOC143917659 [Arctopsyche grandis]|uniref:uncharacterized protein LOC143917659 n=1 Tax=Arctopsyche grandis TaxID=121162 RepID=UPI00406D9A4A